MKRIVPIRLSRPRDPLSIEFLEVQKLLLSELGEKSRAEPTHA
jgi:hypothetical protein